MKEIKIEKLYPLRYTASVLNAILQTWNNADSYNFFGNPKKQHLFLCLTGCSAVYTLKDGTSVVAPSDSIVYAPEGCEYRVEFSNCDTSREYNCIAINFKLSDEDNLPFCFSENIRIYKPKNFSKFITHFLEIADNFRYAVYAPMKITGLFYVLLSALADYYHIKNTLERKHNVIAKGISALESTSISEIRIEDLAKLCNVSCVYFRKLFKEYAGTTPIEYKLNVLITQAKQHLLYSNKSVNEIAETLGFSSTTYFCRIFKKKTGMSPTEYIKKTL